MTKPFAVAVRDTQREIIEIINNSELPIDMTRMILKEVYELVNEQANNMYQKDLQAYKESQDNKDN